MTSPRTDEALAVRVYRDEDEAGVLDLLTAALGGGPVGTRPANLFRWKHLDNSFGRSFMLVAEADERIVGLRAFLRWEFRAGERMVRAVRAVDTATHPDHQGRGIFSRLTREALERLRGDADLVFNTPNDKSRPGYLKMGWRAVGTVPVRVRPHRPLRLLTRRRRSAPAGSQPRMEAESAAEALAGDGSVDALLAEAESGESLLTTPRDLHYLRWRYGAAPLLDYRAVREESGGDLRGLALFRVRPRAGLWEATVAEVIVPSGDVRAARALLRRVALAAPVDHLTCSFPAGSAPARAARRAGYLPAPGGIRLVANPLRDGLDPDPTELRSWALSLGDLEVF